MKTLKYAAFAIISSFVIAPAAFSQETQTRVVDEVVAQVNNSVITLSSVNREIKNAVDSLVQEGKKRDEAQKMVEEKRGELIANLINEQLLIDKSKDLGMDSEVEAQINQKLADIMKQLNVKTVDAVYAEMEKNGLNPNDLKDTWRRQIIKDLVIQRDVQGKLYWGFNGKELRDYYEKHKDKFTKPETVSFSELFLGFAGRDEAAVRDKAKKLYDQLRANGDWAKIVKDNGDPGAVTQGEGKAENIRVAELPPMVAQPIKDIKVGDYTYPFEIKDLGVVILKVDARDQASSESVYNENAVRMAMMSERFPDEQKRYMAKLRETGYVQINDAYRPLVSPILYGDERTEKPKTTKDEKTEKPSTTPSKNAKNAKQTSSTDSSSQKTASKKDKQSN